LQGDRGEIAIRRAVPTDAEALQELGIASFVAAFANLYSPEDLDAFLSENYGLGTWQRLVAQPDQPIWVATTSDGNLVGYAHASLCDLPVDPMPVGALQLRRLYVRPDTLSAGIGAALMLRVFEWVEAAGRPPLFLGFWSGNDRAQRFYSRYRFSKVGEYDFPVGAQVDREFIFRRD
jgi:diamine N-acetyltransferase